MTKARLGQAAAVPSWARILETPDSLSVAAGGEHGVWARRELRKLADLPLAYARAGVVVLPNNAWNREAVARVLWKCLRVSYADAIAAQREYLGAVPEP